MAAFNAKSFEKKLKQIDGSQTSIQTLSLWIIHHRSHASLISAAWLEYLRKASKPEKKLRLFYLANDVVQNGRKKAKELTNCFLHSFREALVLLGDPKIYGQVARVLEIWVERKVFDAVTVKDLKKIHELGQKVAATPKVEQPIIEKEKTTEVVKVVPTDFKVPKLLVTIKKVTSLENDLERKSKTLDNLKIDASSFDSVQHVKDRSSVGKFFKQFEESKIILDDYCHSLRRSEKEKKSLMNLLTGGEVFYDLAQDEAKMIVKAYETFGNRLHAMKKKLDSKIRKFENEKSVTDVMMKRKHESRSSTSSIQDDMELESDSGDEIAESERYNPSTAPIHDTSDDLSQENISRENSMEDETTSIENNNVFTGNTTNDKEKIPSNHGKNIEPNFMAVHDGVSSDNQNTITPLQMGEFQITNFSDIESTSSVQLPMQTFLPNPSTTPGSFNLIPSTTLPFNPVTEQNAAQLIVSSQMTAMTQLGNNPMIVQSSSATEESENGKVQNLIDSLFPMLSKSLQTIKEKQQSVNDDNENRPSISDAMAFALDESVNSSSTDKQGVSRKKSRFSYSDPSTEDTSPVSLTNPNGLSTNQTELISIAAGLTKFDENFLPVNNNISEEVNTEDNSNRHKEEIDNREKRKDERKSRSSRHKSHRDEDRHKRSSSRSPSRKHHRSRDSRDEKFSRGNRDDKHHDSKRRSSRRSTSPKRRKSRSSRSSSLADREENKRKSSPYYNDRRSPTPEMDAQMSMNPPFSQSIIDTNTLAQPYGSQNNHDMSDQNQANPINPVLNMSTSNGAFPFQAKPDISVSNTIGLPQNVGDGNTSLANPFNHALPQNMPMNQFQMGPPRLEFDSTGRPMLAPSLQLRPSNPLQIIPGTDIRGNVVHLRPLPPGMVSTQPRLIPPMQPNLMPLRNPFDQMQNTTLLGNNIDMDQSSNEQMHQNQPDTSLSMNQDIFQNDQIFDIEQKEIVENYLNSDIEPIPKVDKQYDMTLDEPPPREFFTPNLEFNKPRIQTRFPVLDPYIQELELRNPISQERPHFSNHQQPRFRPRFGPRFRPRFRPNFPQRGGAHF